MRSGPVARPERLAAGPPLPDVPGLGRLRPGVVWAVVLRDYLVTRSYRLAFLLDIFHGLLELAAFFFVSRTFEGVTPANLQDAPSYFAFAAVGIGVATVVNAATDGIARRLRDEQLTGTLEALVAQPVKPTELCAGLVGFPFLFAVARGTVYLAIAAALIGVDLSHASWLGLVVLLLCAGLAFSALGVLTAALVLVVKRGPVLANAIMFSMALLGGSVFPVSALPDWLEPLGKILPTRFAYDGARAALFEGANWGDDAVVLLVIAILALPAVTWVFHRALLLTSQKGTLTQY